MTTEPQPSAPGAQPNLIERAKNILLQPRAEWDRIALEPANVPGLYLGYVLPLAALAAIAAAIGGVVFGYGGFGFFVRLDPMTGIVQAITQVVFALIGIFVLAFVIKALAPNFGSEPNQDQAHKLAAYSMTASFLAGCFAIVPALTMLGILGLYSFVLLYLGLPRLMKTPEDKRVGYFVTILVVAIVIGVVLSVVMTTVRTALPLGGFGSFGGFNIGQQEQRPDANVQLPGGGSVDLGDLQRGVEQMEQNMQQGQSVTLDPAALQALLPQNLPGGFNRTSVSSNSSGAAGMNVAQAEASYTRGNDSIQLSVVHMGAMSGLATMGAAMGVQSNTETADGYSRTSTADGRTITEELSRGGQTAKYMVITRTGVAITADGRGAVSGDDVRNAVNAVNPARVEALPSAPAQTQGQAPTPQGVQAPLPPASSKP